MIPGSDEIALAIAGSPALSLLVKATVVSVAALAGTRLARRYRASVRHLMYAAAFVVLLALPLVQFFVPARQVSMPLLEPAPVVAAVTPAPVIDTQLAGSPLGDLDPETPAQRQSRALPPLSTVLLTVWTVGTALVLVPMIGGLIRVRRVRRNGLPWRDGQLLVASIASAAAVRRPIQLLLEATVDGPMTCGVVRPAILLPSDARQWPVEDLQRAVVHEIEHVRRADWLTLCLARSVCAIYWFHPLVWMLRRQLRLEAERACDDAVLRNADPETYADQLVTLAERLVSNRMQSALAMADRDDLSARVSAVLDDRQSRGRAGFVCIAGAAIAAAVVIAAIAPLRAVAVARAGATAEALPGAPVSAITDGPVAGAANEGVSRQVAARLAEAAMFPPPPAPEPAREEAPEADALGTGAAPLAHPALSPPSAVVGAQGAAKPETFDAASIRRTSESTPSRMRDEPSGLTATNVTALNLIVFAYGVLEREVVGELPDWAKTMRFDVVARTANGPLTPRRLLEMTRALLEDRFRLEASYEQVSGPVLALVRERPDGKPAPNLRPSESNCHVDAPLELRTTPGLGGRCGVEMMSSPGDGMVRFSGAGVTIREFARSLSRYGGYDHPIVDRTGLIGEFDVWATASGDIVAPTRQARLLIALREQTGLTLRGEEGIYEVLRIRRIEQPSEN